MELNLRYNRHFYSSALLNPLDAPMQRTWERAKLATTLDHVGKSSIYLIYLIFISFGMIHETSIIFSFGAPSLG